MKARVDLHLHTTCSDGVKTPDEVVEMVRRRSLAAFAIADHDSVEGYWAAEELIGADDPELIPAVELSCSGKDVDLHMLGYCFDPSSQVLAEALVEFRKRRNQRGLQMVEKLGELGVDISYDDVLRCAGAAPVGRPHVAQALFEAGVVDNYDMAFHKYIGDHGPAYVPKVNMHPADAIGIIHRSGGVAVLAHPMINHVYDHLKMLVEAGLDGLEAWHPEHKISDTDRLKHMAEKHSLLVTGGSDYHGRPGRYGTVGSEPVRAEVAERLKEVAHDKRGIG
jgi:predicted metal-dependent phosphoesterase TrpH